jgi:hypothetical protein
MPQAAPGHHLVLIAIRDGYTLEQIRKALAAFGGDERCAADVRKAWLALAEAMP